MNVITCPYCQHETNDKVCNYCYKEITSDSFNDVSPLKYQLEMALIINDYESIIRLSNQILNKTPDNLVLFYLEYALAKVERKSFNYNKDLNNQELFQAIIYLRNHHEEIELINLYLVRFTDDEVKSKLNNNIDLSDKLFPLVGLRIKPEVNKNIQKGLGLLIFGGVLTAVFVVISLLIPINIRSFITILILIIPCLLLAAGLAKFNKHLSFLREIVFFLLLIIISYLTLIYLEPNIIDHLKNVVLAPYDFLKYLLGKIIINI